MTKIRTTITINKELLKIAQHHKIRISTLLDNNLRNYLSQINGKNNLRRVEAAGLNPTQSIGNAPLDTMGDYLYSNCTNSMVEVRKR